MNHLNEIWLSVKGYAGKYEVSNLGNVKSLDRAEDWCGFSRKRNGRILKKVVDKDGYFKVCLRDGFKNRGMSVHVLVASAFIPNPNNKPTVNHKDGCKTNNDFGNLEWATVAENTQHAHDKGLAKAPRFWAGRSGLLHISSKGVSQIDKCTGLVINKYGSQKEASEKTGIPEWRISYYLRGMRNKEQNFHWEHLYENPKAKFTWLTKDQP